MTTLRRQVKNMVKNYSEAEVKVREATSNDPWGPSSTLMSEISDLTYNIVALGEVMRMIWKRLNDHGKNWRHVYKSLVLLDYLIKNGNEKVAQQCKEHIVAIQTLKDFQYMEEQKDQGQSVREKAKQLVNLLRDDERLKQERTKAFKARERFAQNAMGISSDNKMTYATSSAGASARAGTSHGSGRTAYADPYGGAGTSATADLSADLEAVRPSDNNEEELQIKLAMMLSQQEHEEAAQKQRADEAKLQLALEQSKSEGQPNGLVDLEDTGFGASSDPWGNSQPTTSNQQPKQFSEFDSGSDELFPPINNFNSNNNGATTQKPAQPQQQAADPWGLSNGSNTTNPWQSPSGTNNSKPVASLDDPWASTASPQQQQQPAKLDEFDLFTSNRAVNQSPLTTSTANKPTPPANADPFGDFFGSTDQAGSNASTNPWNASDNQKNDFSASQPLTATTKSTTPNSMSNSQSFAQAANQRKTPESFLGENSSLVNLENLIPARPKSTNPFGSNQAILSTAPSTNGMSSSTSSGQLNNPFLAQQALQNQNKPTISQLQSQQKQQQQITAFPSFGQQATTGFGQLPQPLIPPSNSIPNMGQLSFSNSPSFQQPLSATPPPQINGNNMFPTQMAPPTQSNFNAFNQSNGQSANQTNPFLMM